MKTSSDDDPTRNVDCGDGAAGDGASDDLPFPDSDFPLQLQRILARKLAEEKESGEAVTEAEFKVGLRKAIQRRRSDSASR